MYLTEGIRWIEEALSAPAALAAVLVSPRLGATGRGLRLRERLARLACERYELSDALLGSVAHTRACQGVLALLRCPPEGLDCFLRAQLGRRQRCLWIVASGIQDPGNLGGLLRTAWVLQATGFVTHASADLFHPRAVRASAGALLRMPVARAASEKELCEALEQVEAHAAVPCGGSDPRALDWSRHCALVLGSEAHGLSAAVLAACRGRVSVAMRAHSESLNVGAAAAALLALIGPAARLVESSRADP